MGTKMVPEIMLECNLEHGSLEEGRMQDLTIIYYTLALTTRSRKATQQRAFQVGTKNAILIYKT